MHTNCIFCKIIAREIPAKVIDETDDIIVIQDAYPKANIHYLIIPKVHITDIQSLDNKYDELGSKMFSIAKKLSHNVEQKHGSGDFRFQINSGIKAGQRVFHLHAHFMANDTLDE